MYINGEMKNAQLEKFTTAAKPAGVESQIGYNLTTKHPEFYNGNTWVDWMASSSGMQNPANTLFVSSAFNNTSPYYNTIDGALASTSSDVTLVIFQEHIIQISQYHPGLLVLYVLDLLISRVVQVINAQYPVVICIYMERGQGSIYIVMA